MTATGVFPTVANPLSPAGRSWPETVLVGDRVWQQTAALLTAHGANLAETPRRPDVRLILNNISGQDVSFYNPKDHSGQKLEVIPGTGDKTAAMVMLAGTSIEEQQANAIKLLQQYDLGNTGLSAVFVGDLMAGKLAGQPDSPILEAYGPAPFQKQCAQLTVVEWTHNDGVTVSRGAPYMGAAAAFGPRALNEKAMICKVPVALRGTNTVAELLESDGMVLVINEDWQTKAVSTRPVVPSVARGFFGNKYDTLPLAEITPDGQLMSLDLRNGTVLKTEPPEAVLRRARRLERGGGAKLSAN